jgi:hypothetical protein
LGQPTAPETHQDAIETTTWAAPYNCGGHYHDRSQLLAVRGLQLPAEIILWDGANPATRVAVATLDAVGKALGPYATWWTPPAKDSDPNR